MAVAAPRISLEQWRCLAAVVEAGGYAQAAERLHKSQSSVTYAVQKLESSLKVHAFEIQGRKAVLTGVGQMLYRRARTLLDDAGDLERAARKASAGWEAEIGIAIEVLFPTWLMFECLGRFGAESPQTRIEWIETVLAGTAEALRDGLAELGIATRVPTGLNGELLMPIPFVPVAHPDHPLHQLGREITNRDLRKYRHLVVRDSGAQRDKKSQVLEVEQRWTVTNLSTSIGAVSRGHGFAWLPQDKIRTELGDGTLKILPLRGGRERSAQLYMFFADPDAAGPGTRRLAEIIREQVAGACEARGADRK
ncbi:MAG TPA: LysR family transcriptional regulator [Steroidobacteraceae bacterium]|nr:LysR family transcriptional regulator [Steroidobacteraceae bacterium]